jgi:hypothetical protein
VRDDRRDEATASLIGNILLVVLLFGGLALLIRRYGDTVRAFIEQRLMLVTSVAGVSILLGFVVLRYL